MKDVRRVNQKGLLRDEPRDFGFIFVASVLGPAMLVGFIAAFVGFAPTSSRLLSITPRSRTIVASDKWYVKTETFIKGKPFPEIKPHLDEHKTWVDSLRADSVAITSGYRVDANDKPGGGGLMLFRASDYAAAEALVLQDPLIANGCVDWQLNRWIAEVRAPMASLLSTISAITACESLVRSATFSSSTAALGTISKNPPSG